MAVSIEYLDKVGFATIRREPGDNSDEAIDALLAQYIEQARADLVKVGVAPEIATNEDNPNVLGAINSFVRWKMSFNGSDSTPNRDEYRLQADELRKSVIESYIPEEPTEDEETEGVDNGSE